VLVLARHASTPWNRQRRYQGWADVPLDEEGFAEADRLGGSLATICASDEVRLASSDLRRAVQTAGVVAAHLGGVPQSVWADLREVDVGGWEGLTEAEASRVFPEEFDRWKAGADVRRGGGETEAEAGRRAAFRLGRLLEADATTVVVGHGLSIRAALERLRRWGRLSFDGPAPHLGNCGFVVVDDGRLVGPEALAG
jgi:probable phosphoglycerate mutase